MSKLVCRDGPHCCLQSLPVYLSHICAAPFPMEVCFISGRLYVVVYFRWNSACDLAMYRFEVPSCWWQDAVFFSGARLSFLFPYFVWYGVGSVVVPLCYCPFILAALLSLTVALFPAHLYFRLLVSPRYSLDFPWDIRIRFVRVVWFILVARPPPCLSLCCNVCHPALFLFCILVWFCGKSLSHQIVGAWPEYLPAPLLWSLLGSRPMGRILCILFWSSVLCVCLWCFLLFCIGCSQNRLSIPSCDVCWGF